MLKIAIVAGAFLPEAKREFPWALANRKSLEQRTVRCLQITLHIRGDGSLHGR
jgi:hypothetical protein